MLRARSSRECWPEPKSRPFSSGGGAGTGVWQVILKRTLTGHRIGIKGRLFVAELTVGGGVLVADEAQPVGAEGVREGVIERLACRDREGGEFRPRAVPGEVGFYFDGDRFPRLVADGQALFVETGGQIGIAGGTCFDGGIQPGAALAAGFAELPDVIDRADSEGTLVVGAADDVIGGWGIGQDAAEDEQAAVAGEIVNAAAVGAEGPDFGEATGVAGGQFVEGAVDTEEIPLGADFAAEPGRSKAGVLIEGGLAAGEAPAFSIGHLIDQGSGVGSDERRGDGGFLPDKGRQVAIVGKLQGEIRGEFVGTQRSIRVAGGEGEGLEAPTPGLEFADGLFGVGGRSQPGSRHAGGRRAGIGPAVVEKGGDAGGGAVRFQADPSAGFLVGKFRPVAAVGGDRDLTEGGPVAVPFGIGLQGENDGSIRGMGQVQGTMGVPVEKVGFADRSGGNVVLDPDAAPSQGRVASESSVTLRLQAASRTISCKNLRRRICG